MPSLLLDSAPDDTDVDRDDDGFIVTVPAIEDGPCVVSLDVRLDPMEAHGLGTFEASFGFTIFDFDGGELAFFTQDRYEIERYFGDCTREFVLPTVCVALSALVTVVQPAYIFRVTKGRELPQKALRKHLLITDHLLGSGFQTVDEGTDDLGRLFWLMGR